jgi:hypothetical protein
MHSHLITLPGEHYASLPKWVNDADIFCYQIQYMLVIRSAKSTNGETEEKNKIIQLEKEKTVENLKK